VRVVGALMFLAGAAVAGRAVLEIFRARRPRDVAAAIVATAATVAAVLGAVWIVVPTTL